MHTPQSLFICFKHILHTQLYFFCTFRTIDTSWFNKGKPLCVFKIQNFYRNSQTNRDDIIIIDVMKSDSPYSVSSSKKKKNLLAFLNLRTLIHANLTNHNSLPLMFPMNECILLLVCIINHHIRTTWLSSIYVFSFVYLIRDLID